MAASNRRDDSAMTAAKHIKPQVPLKDFYTI